MGLKIARIVWRENTATSLPANTQFPSEPFGLPTNNEVDYFAGANFRRRVVPFNQKVCDSHGIITSPAGIVSGPPAGSSGSFATPNWVSFPTTGLFSLQQGTYQITINSPQYCSSNNRWGVFRLIDAAGLYGSQINIQNYKSGELAFFSTRGTQWEGSQWTFTYNNYSTIANRFKTLIFIPNVDLRWVTTVINGWRQWRYFITMDFVKISNS